MRFGSIFLLASSLALTSCAALQKVVTEAEAPAPIAETPALVDSLPEELGTFSYQGYRYFQDESDGYTFRYTNEAKKRIADVYVYPVAEENADLKHADLVMGSTRATIEAIGEAVKDGYYANFNVVGAATQARGVRTVARVEATYLKQNLASYTLVYQTEYDGTLLKIRVSMPDNESNRSNTEWDNFADEMLNTIIAEIKDDKADEVVASAKTET